MRKSKIAPILLSIVLLIAISGCGKPVHTLADQRGLTYGVSVQAGDVLAPKTVKIIKDNFNLIVPENTLKWQNIRPTKDFWNWSDMDNIVAFAEKNKMKMKGHTFLWHQQNPPYVNALKNRDEALAMMKEQISTVMKRYKGRIYEYDICNEVLNEDGTMRDTVWYRTIGPEYIDIAFSTAKASDPAAKLVLNDYNNENMGDAKADGFYELVKGMKERGVPIDGVGFQMHLMAKIPVNEQALRSNIRRFNDLGIYVSFTEIDIRIQMPVDDKKEAEQVAAYTKLIDIASTEKMAGSFIMWGYTDKLSWIPRFFPGYGSAHLYDNRFKPKPAYYAIKKMLEAPIKGPSDFKK